LMYLLYLCKKRTMKLFIIILSRGKEMRERDCGGEPNLIKN
jgi:hypothetical protein